MKRLLLAFLLAAALLGLLAAPALATSVPTVRPALATAYVIAYGDGSWLEVTDLNAPAGVAHWAYDEKGRYVLDPIPANYDIVMDMGWTGMPLGQVQSASEKFLIRISIPEAGIDMSFDQGKAFWTGATLWDDFWVALMGPLTAFNPLSGLQAYCNHWWCPLTGNKGIAGNLTSDTKLPRGTYTVYYAESILQPMTGLDLVYDDEGTPLTTPYHATPPGGGAADPYTFTVGRPVK